MTPSDFKNPNGALLAGSRRAAGRIPASKPTDFNGQGVYRGISNAKRAARAQRAREASTRMADAGGQLLVLWLGRDKLA